MMRRYGRSPSPALGVTGLLVLVLAVATVLQSGVRSPAEALPVSLDEGIDIQPRVVSARVARPAQTREAPPLPASVSRSTPGASRAHVDRSPDPAQAEILELGLDELWEDPLPLLGRRVRFVLQLARLREEWNPYQSRFDAQRWLGLEGWSDRFLWNPDVYGKPFGRVFVRRGSEAEALVQGAGTYRRFEVEGVVREVFLDEPWVEVVSLEALEEHVLEGTILHVERAIALMLDGAWWRAAEQLERARRGPLPRHVREELERMIAECMRTAEHYRRR